ncbi:hypothetical protein I35_0567 [Burkholderia cenocepacia H111]|nr:uncharacterized protein BCN122_I3119 [Burkholderia cenocepacia]PRG72971.1 hypothetical protein C6T64_11995 [Burkholderia cenocepacia]CDN59090.1 hypothetical protein I35_0567 [Burkholderia cenocepacia H111]
MHRRSPCRCTFCSRRPPSRRRPARAPHGHMRRSGDYRRAKKPPRPGNGNAAVDPRRPARWPAVPGSLTAA